MFRILTANIRAANCYVKMGKLACLLTHTYIHACARTHTHNRQDVNLAIKESALMKVVGSWNCHEDKIKRCILSHLLAVPIQARVAHVFSSNPASARRTNILQ